jgi:hypothetical protein
MQTPDDHQKAHARDEALAYLAATDWYVVRTADPSDGKAIPDDVLAKRRAARAVLNG